MSRNPIVSVPLTSPEFPAEPGDKFLVTVPEEWTGQTSRVRSGDVFEFEEHASGFFGGYIQGALTRGGVALDTPGERAQLNSMAWGWLSPLEPAPPEPAMCSCDIIVLCGAGCKCGAIEPYQREPWKRRNTT